MSGANSKHSQIKTVADADPWLEPYRPKLEQRQQYIAEQRQRILDGLTVTEFALGHLYYGLHKTSDGGWVFREWAPNATKILMGVSGVGA